MIAVFVLITSCGVSLPEAEISGALPTDTVKIRHFDLQAHRGGRGLRPENTLPAFEHALDLEVTTLELDLHLTQDGVVVIT
ncbi:MAG: glycerophosphodiester phosphodiesterase, partial [Deltaproteobacteria bacterium]|nr:glycerophosphodiester phosphodiesterase [Deltaproteobacteria bacterium]